MSRAKPKIRHTRAWWGGRVDLRPGFVTALAQVLALDDRRDIEAMTEAVAEAVAQYPGLVEALDRGPRPAHVRAALVPVAKHAQQLWEELSDLDTTSAAGLRHRGVDLAAAAEILGRLAAAATVAVLEAGEAESRRRPCRGALAMITRQLARVFEHFENPAAYEGPGGGRRDRMLEFVALALDAGGIDRPGDDRLVKLLPRGR